MKRFSYEKIKTIILIILILSSIFFTYRLWFRDHNLFDIFGGDKKVLKSQNGIEYIYLPPKILANMGESSHVIIRPIHEEYATLQKESLKIIKQALSVQKYEVLDISEWNNILSSKSLLFGYQTNIKTGLLIKLLNITNSYAENNISYIKDIIIIQDSTVSDNIKCYIKDETQGKVYLAKFSYDDSVIDTLVAGIESKNLGNYVTGYELKHNLLKDDVLLLPTDEVVMGKQIKFSNEVDIESANEVKSIAQKFFEKFNVVKNVEYKDESKTKVIEKEFIDRKRILKMYKSGLIEYTSAEIPNDKVQTDMISALKLAIDFADNSMELPKNSYISEIKELPESKGFTFSFDYSIEGLDVKLTAQDVPKHAVEIEVKGDIVTSYKRYVKTFTVGKEKELNVLNLKAVDQAIIDYRQKTGQKDINKAVNNVQLVYADYGQTEGYPYWYVEIDNQEFLINSVTEEN